MLLWTFGEYLLCGMELFYGFNFFSYKTILHLNIQGQSKLQALNHQSHFQHNQ